MDISKFILILWIPITLIAMNSLGPGRGATIGMLGASLLLPNYRGFDFPAIPPLGKQEIGTVSVLLGAMFYYPMRLSRIRVGFGVDLLIGVLILGGIGTALTNSDVLVYGPRVLQGTTRWDALSNVARDLLFYGFPFVLGRALVRTRRDLQSVFQVLVAAAFLYTFLMLIELRMAPQIHKWVYGFHGTYSFSQHMRYGGYRPVVFMTHGLAVATFVATGTMAAIALGRTPLTVFGQRAYAIWPYLAIVLYLCKSMAAILYGALGGVLIQLTKPKLQIQIASVMVIGVLLYPASRIAGVFPTEDLAETMGILNPVRADSLRYRFEHEELLLEKATERMLLGWGGYNRNRVFDEVLGGAITVTDGAWIIYLGRRGIVGTLAFFGLLALPVVVAQRRFSLLDDPLDQRLIAGLALIVGFSSIDLLPNGLFTTWPMFFAGALLGTMQHLTSPAMLRQRQQALANDEAGTAVADPTPVGFAVTNPDRPASLGAARRMR